MTASIKGSTILNTMSILRELMDQRRLNALIDSCPQDTKLLLRRTVMAVEWVPVDVWSPMLHAIFERVTGRDEPKFRRFIRAACQRDFSGPYRVYVQNTTPASVLVKAQGIWNSYFDSGTLTAGPVEPKDGGQHCLISLRELESSAPIYVVVVQAILEQLLSMVDAKTVVIQRVRDTRRENYIACDYRVTFR